MHLSFKWYCEKKGVKNQKFSNTGFRIYLCSYFCCCSLFLHLPSSVLVLIPEEFSLTVINTSSGEKTLNFCLPGDDLFFLQIWRITFSYLYSLLLLLLLLSCFSRVRPHRQQPTRLPRPWDSPGKNTGVGCHFLLQCMHAYKVASVVSNSVRPHGQQPTRILCPQNSHWVSLNINL